MFLDSQKERAFTLYLLMIFKDQALKSFLTPIFWSSYVWIWFDMVAHLDISILTFKFVYSSVFPSDLKLALIPSIVSQNNTCKVALYMLRVKNMHYVSPSLKISIKSLQCFITSLVSVGPKLLCSLHSTVRMYTLVFKLLGIMTF